MFYRSSTEIPVTNWFLKKTALIGAGIIVSNKKGKIGRILSDYWKIQQRYIYFFIDTLQSNTYIPSTKKYDLLSQYYVWPNFVSTNEKDQ